MKASTISAASFRSYTGQNNQIEPQIILNSIGIYPEIAAPKRRPIKWEPYYTSRETESPNEKFTTHPEVTEKRNSRKRFLRPIGYLLCCACILAVIAAVVASAIIVAELPLKQITTSSTTTASVTVITTTITTATTATTTITTATTTTATTTTATTTTTTTATTATTTTATTTTITTVTTATTTTATTSTTSKTTSTTITTTSTTATTTPSCTSPNLAGLIFTFYTASMPLTYTLYTYGFIANGSSSTLTFAITGDSGPGQHYWLLDSVSVNYINGSTSLLMNGGFETGDFTDWVQFCATDANCGTGFYGQLTTSPCYSGAFCYMDRCNSGGHFDYLLQSFSTVSGGYYVISFYMRAFANGGPHVAYVMLN